MPPNEVIEQRFELPDLRAREVVLEGEVGGDRLTLGEGEPEAGGDDVDQLPMVLDDRRRQQAGHDVAHRARAPGCRARVSRALARSLPATLRSQGDRAPSPRARRPSQSEAPGRGGA